MSTLNPNPSSNDEKFMFASDQHATNISEKLLKFYEDKYFFDIVLIAGDDCINIPAHKIVLSAMSQFFLQQFRSTCSISNSKEFKLKDIEATTLKFVIAYMYSGSIELSFENIAEVLRIAVFLKIKDLVDGCCAFLEANLNPSNCLYWLRFAEDLSVSRLQEKIWNYIYKNFEAITNQCEFLLLNKSELLDLLFNENLHENLEEQVFVSFMNWIEYQKVNRQHLLLELLSKVRYHFLTPKFIVENRTDENAEIVHKWLLYHLSPESRNIEQQNLFFHSELRSKVNLSEENNKVAIINFNDNNEAELRSYNQTLETWSIEKRSKPLWRLKSQYSSIVIDDKLFIVGGLCDDEEFHTVEFLDLKTFKQGYLPKMKNNRYDCQLANFNGHLCVFGGFKNTCHVFYIEIFNFSTQKWTEIKPLFIPTTTTKIVGHNNILYMIDFYYGSLQFYDVTSNKWTSKDQRIYDGVRDFSVVACGKFLYCILVGEDYRLPNDKIVYKKTIVKRFDLSNYTWTKIAELQKNESFIKKVTVNENTILFLKENGVIVEFNLNTEEFTSLATSHYSNVCILPFKLK